MQLESAKFRVQDLNRSISFYTKILGMTCKLIPRPGEVLLSYPDSGNPFSLHLIQYNNPAPSTAYLESKNDLFWKTGIAVPHVDHTRNFLLQQNLTVSHPVQYGDIGYLCHLRDPDGFLIELLQHSFGRKEPQKNIKTPPWEKAHIGQLSIRVKDPLQSLRFYQLHFGMKLSARMKSVSPPFELFFLGDKNMPGTPCPDPADTRNREWLWSQPATTLELLHNPGTGLQNHFSYKTTDPDSCGLTGAAFSSCPPGLKDPDGLELFQGFTGKQTG